MRLPWMTLAAVGACAAGVCALAQPSTTTTYIGDINGRTVEASSIHASGQPADRTHTERWQSINGRSVPLEQVEERVIQDTPAAKITERIVRKYSPAGEYSSTEKIVTEEHKTPNSSTVKEAVFRSDVNGNLKEDERRTTETRGTGNNTSSEMVIARPTVNGSMQTVEKRVTSTSGNDEAWRSSQSVYRLSQNGGFYEALRQVTDATKKKDRSTDSTAYYEVRGTSGTFELTRQSVSVTTKAPDGREVTETNLYAPAADGRVQEPGARQQIKEQQIIEKRKNADGSYTELFSVRRPSLSDPRALGGVQPISETICKGKCD